MASPFVVQFVGSLSNCAINVDKHGVALTNANLPGHRWTHCHNRIQDLLLNMANFAALDADAEAKTFLNGRVPEHLLKWQHKMSKNIANLLRIMPDWLIQDLPPDPNGPRTQPAGLAIIEVKGIRKNGRSKR